MSRENKTVMLQAIRNALEKTNNIKRSTYTWNAINASFSAAQSAMVLIVMSRTNGLADAGIFSIAYAVASLMLFVGQYGIRRFQASDVGEQFTFEDYCGMRIITCTAMILASLLYCIYAMAFSGYTGVKFLIVFLVCVQKSVQAFADVLHGRMQQKGRLDVAAKASAARIVFCTGTYMIALVVTHQLVLSTIIWVIATFLFHFLGSVNAATNYCSLRPRFQRQQMRSLALVGLPLFLSYFLSMYVGNAPKYAIDAYLSDEIQAYYNFIFMPAFAVQLLANFIFNPILTTYAHMWAERKFKTFRKAILRQLVVVAGITAAGLAVAATIGIPILSIIFGVDLGAFKGELCVVMIGGGMLAYVTFFTTVITIIRHQNLLLIGYGAVAIAAKLFAKPLVLQFQMMGAASLYALLMACLALFFAVIMVVKIRSDKKKILVKETL